MEQQKDSPEEKEKQEKLENERKERIEKERNNDRTNLKWAIVVIVFNFGLTILSILWIFTNLFWCCKVSLGTLYSFGMKAEIASDMFFAGVLGGACYCIRGLYIRMPEAYPSSPEIVKKPLNMTGWALWYFYRPLQGGVLALILLVLTKSNLLKLDEAGSADTNSIHFLVAIGFFAGFGAHEVMEKIEAIIKIIFGSTDNHGSKPPRKEDKPDKNTTDAEKGNTQPTQGAGQGKTNESNTGTNGATPKPPEAKQQDKSETPTNEESGASSTEEPSPEENPVNGEGSDQPK